MPFERRSLFVFLFAVSGFTGLIYESIWTHYLKLFLGHTAYAQTLVLAIFMAGIALGSWICSAYSGRWKNLLAGYALAEAAIGLLALVFPVIFVQALEWSYDRVIPNLGSPQTVIIFKWVLSGLMILPQTILLGMTFPLMTSGIIRDDPHNQGGSISLLYFANSFGAALGVLTSGFLLVRLLGLPGTIRLAGFINILLSICVWMLIRGVKAPTPGPAPAPESAPSGQRRWHRLLLLASLITGMSSFIYEIGWIRMLSLVLGSSTHAFELMLSAFIFGLAFGGLWIRSRLGRISDTLLFLVSVQIIMGLLALSTLLLYGRTFAIMKWMMDTLSKTDAGYLSFNLLSSAIAVGVMLPTTFCAGMTLPLITYALIKQGNGEASIGAVYAFNTVGAIMGVFIAVHLGMPLLGLKGLMILGGSLDLILGVALLWVMTGQAKSFRMRAGVTIGCACIIMAAVFFVNLDPYRMASGVFRYGKLQAPENSELLFHKDGKTATVSLFLEDGALDIRTNGKSDAVIQTDPDKPRSGDEATMILLAVLPLALHPEAKTAANVGFGSGLTTAALLNSRLEQVDTIEIEPAMIEAAKGFGALVEPAYTDPRSRIYIDDAKTFFSARGRSYDIIISEPSNPWVSGTAGLFSEEFYRMAGRHLTERGVFCQWLQLYELDIELAVSVLKALSSSFTDFVVYAANDWDILIIARNGVSIADPAPSVFNDLKTASSLKRIQINSIDDLKLRKIGDKKFFSSLLRVFPVRQNSDFYPVLDQHAVKSRFLQSDARELVSFTYVLLPVMEMITGTPAPAGHAPIAYSPDFMKAQAVSSAAELSDYIVTGRFADRQSVLPESIRVQAARLRSLFFEECGAGSEERIEVMYHIMALLMNPFLHPDELEAVWRRLEAGACFYSFSPRDMQWIGLFKAVGQRDAQAMAGSAETLLMQEVNLPKGPMNYLLASGMLGRLAEGRGGESRLLWQKYHTALFGAEQPPLLFRFLVSAASGN